MRALTPRSLALALSLLPAAACGSSGPAPQQPETTSAAAPPPAETAPTAPVSNEVAPPPVAAPPGLPPELPEVCRRYLAHLDALMACPAFPEEARAAIPEVSASFRDSWASFAMLPPDARDAVEEACTSATAAVEQVATGVGCPL